MLRKERDGLTVLEFEKLQDFPHLRHAVFTKQGGISSGSHQSLNLGFKASDTVENVLENRAKMARALTSALTKDAHDKISIVSLDQVHKDHVGFIENSLQEDVELQATDAVMTNQKKTALMIKHADCQAAIFYDPQNEAYAAVHAGWRGSCLNIYKKTVEEMIKKYHSKPEDLIVCISPSLGPENAEFKNYKTELPEEFW